MSKFKNSFPTKLSTKKRYFTSRIPEFDKNLRDIRVYSIFCLFRNFRFRTRGRYSKVFDLFAFEICYVSYRAYRIEISIVIIAVL